MARAKAPRVENQITDAVTQVGNPAPVAVEPEEYISEKTRREIEVGRAALAKSK